MRRSSSTPGSSLPSSVACSTNSTRRCASRGTLEPLEAWHSGVLLRGGLPPRDVAFQVSGADGDLECCNGRYRRVDAKTYRNDRSDAEIRFTRNQWRLRPDSAHSSTYSA